MTRLCESLAKIELCFLSATPLVYFITLTPRYQSRLLRCN